MRVDKFLKVSRILRRRTLAAQACSLGKVYVNDRITKPGHQLNIGDKVKIEFGSNTLSFRVLSLNDKASKNEAGLLYEIID